MIIETYSKVVFIAITLSVGLQLSRPGNYSTLIGYLICLPLYFRAMGWV